MRFGVLALAGLLALPASAAAQNDGGFASEAPAELVPYTRFAVTPWIGFRVPYASGNYFVFTEGGTQYQLDEDRGGGAAIGLDAAYRITGPLNVVAGVGYSGADQNELNILDENGNIERFSSGGPEVWFVKAGLQYRLPDPVPDNRRFHPAAYITVAPAMVFMDWPNYEGIDNDDVIGSTRNFAVNIGVDAVTNIGSRGLALAFSVEDYFTFLDEDRIRVRDEALLGEFFEEPVVISYDENTSNILVLRAGLSWRH
ncbi:hypothetical protein [Longimicrobium sp.]|uniref:hypothetical protein n=1 Tax=Longimicrobium sp. TaxID=2029185 RepID=UPI003B3A85A8